ncbi:hypothetical protein [Bacillus sp. PK3_68]|uniref:hypothetical protein n=1 Tax=Bacillus sp. PK3_68 TaxID=2027408 RepID=UPI0015FF1A33|nr:hypothetical protein [Bacillus sp. PK3_68]
MNIVFFIIIISLFASMISSLWWLKRKESKWLGLLVAFIVNSVILSIATIALYKIDVQTFHKQTDGLFGSLGIVVLVLFIPIITFINYWIVEFKKR